MQWKQNMKRTATTTSAILLALMLAACSDNNLGNNAPTASPDTEQTEQGTLPNGTLPDNTGVLDPGVLDGDANNSSSNKPNPSSKPKDDNQSAPVKEVVSDTLKAEGIYIGAADSHSIEIEVDNEYLVLQLDDNMLHVIEDYAGNEAVSFEYVEKTIEDLNVKQLWLTSITLK